MKKFFLTFYIILFSLIATGKSYAVLNDLKFKSGSYEYKLNIPNGYCYYDENRSSEEIPLITDKVKKQMEEDESFFGFPPGLSEIMLKVLHNQITSTTKDGFDNMSRNFPISQRQEFLAYVPTCISLVLLLSGSQEISSSGYFYILDGSDAMDYVYGKSSADVRMKNEQKKMFELVEDKSLLDDFVDTLDDDALSDLLDKVEVNSLSYLGTTRVKKRNKIQYKDNCLMLSMRQDILDQILAHCFIDDSTFSIMYMYKPSNDINVLKAIREQVILIIDSIE